MMRERHDAPQALFVQRVFGEQNQRTPADTAHHLLLWDDEGEGRACEFAEVRQMSFETVDMIMAKATLGAMESNKDVMAHIELVDKALHKDNVLTSAVELWFAHMNMKILSSGRITAEIAGRVVSQCLDKMRDKDTETWSPRSH